LAAGAAVVEAGVVGFTAVAAGGGRATPATADFGLAGDSVLGADAIGRGVAAAGGGAFTAAAAGFGRTAGRLLLFSGGDGLAV